MHVPSDRLLSLAGRPSPPRPSALVGRGRARRRDRLRRASRSSADAAAAATPEAGRARERDVVRHAVRARLAAQRGRRQPGALDLRHPLRRPGPVLDLRERDADRLGDHRLVVERARTRRGRRAATSRSSRAGRSSTSRRSAAAVREPARCARVAVRPDLGRDRGRGFPSRVQSKYIVYYDGPVGDKDLRRWRHCPERHRPRGVPRPSCRGVDRAEVVAHELLHATGAVPGPAPNECLPPDDGHTCDNDRDMMFPFTDGTPLTVSSSIRAATTTTAIPARGRTSRTRRGSSSSTARRRSPSRSRGRAGSPLRPGPRLHAELRDDVERRDSPDAHPDARAGRKAVRWSGGCSGVSQCTVTVGQASAPTALLPLGLPAERPRLGQGLDPRLRCGNPLPGPVRVADAVVRPAPADGPPAKGWRLRYWSGAVADAVRPAPSR